MESQIYWACAIAAVAMMGFAKGGFVGLGSAALPIFTLVTDPVGAAAVLVPVMLTLDVVGLWLFRGTWSSSALALLLPCALAGVVLGYILAASVSAAVLKICVGVLAMASVVDYRAWATETQARPLLGSAPVGALMGVLSGFTSQVALAGGPPFQTWVMARRLPRETLVGTAAVFFAVLNWAKVPTYLALGGFSWTTLKASMALLPVAAAAMGCSAWLGRRVPEHLFTMALNVILVLVGGKLVLDGLLA